MVKDVVMEAPIAEVKKRFCEMVEKAEHGETIIILRHGRPAAQLTPLPRHGAPWRVEMPDDPKLYKGVDLNEPILGDIE